MTLSTPDTTAILDFARDVIRVEADAVRLVSAGVDDAFAAAVDAVYHCRGAVLTTGIGKAGHVARKLSATLASTGTPSHFLSTADAVHGDLGSIREGDLVLVLSFSGESDEILRCLSIIKKLSHRVIAITSCRSSSLGRSADLVLAMGKISEACPLGLAPSASTTAMMALGDALALSVMKLRNFSADDFALFHPAGQLGRKLIKVKEAMNFHAGKNLPVSPQSLTVRQVIHNASAIKRRPGAVVLVDDAGKLSGLFTDADLRRLLTDGDADSLDRPIAQVMTRQPRCISADALASEAMALMHQYRFDELPVVGADGAPVGLIDVQDLVVLKMFDVEDDAE